MKELYGKHLIHLYLYEKLNRELQQYANKFLTHRNEIITIVAQEAQQINICVSVKV